MNISLSNDLREFVDEKLQRDRYSSASEYVRELIREDIKKEVHARIAGASTHAEKAHRPKARRAGRRR